MNSMHPNPKNSLFARICSNKPPNVHSLSRESLKYSCNQKCTKSFVCPQHSVDSPDSLFFFHTIKTQEGPRVALPDLCQEFVFNRNTTKALWIKYWPYDTADVALCFSVNMYTYFKLCFHVRFPIDTYE